MSQIAILKRELEEARERKRRAQDEILVLERLLSRHDPDWDDREHTPRPAGKARSHENQRIPVAERKAQTNADAIVLARFIHANNGCGPAEVVGQFPHWTAGQRQARYERAIEMGLIRKAGQSRAVRYFKKGALPAEGEEPQQLLLNVSSSRAKKNEELKRKKSEKYRHGPKSEPGHGPKVMSYLTKQKKPVTHRDIAKNCDLSDGSLHWTMKYYVREGIVTRDADDDGRIIYTLTES